jgi:hypothetical protein
MLPLAKAMVEEMMRALAGEGVPIAKSSLLLRKALLQLLPSRKSTLDQESGIHQSIL